MLLAPIFPDEKLNRLKLIALGTGLILCGLFWALTQVFNKELKFHRTPLDWPVAVYAIVAIIFYKSSQNPATAASEFQRMIFSVGAFFAAAQCLSGAEAEKKRRWTVAGWMSGLALISIYGILQKTGGAGQVQVPQLDRVFATFGNPIFFAAFLIVSIPVALGAFLESKGFWRRSALLLTLLLALWALFYTGTRAAFLALPLAMALTWSRELWRNKGKILIVIAVLAALLLSSPKIREAVVSSRATATSQTHTLIWKDVLKMWKAHPWTGTGFGTFHVEFRQYQSAELQAAWPQNERIVNDAHNEYLQILAETGLVGFVAFFAVIIWFFISALRFHLSAASPPPLFAGLLAGGTALLIQNFFSVDMRFIVSSAYLFLVMGMSASYFSKPATFAWPGTFPKALWVGAILAVSGVFWLALVRPYRANRELKAQPDFFEEKYPESIEGLEELARREPDNWKVFDKLGYAYAKTIEAKGPAGGKTILPAMAEKSVNAYLRAHQLNPGAAGPPNNIGNIYYTLQRPDEAIEWWNRAVQVNPNLVDARVNLGIAYFSQGKIKESSAQLEEVLKIDPDNKTALVLLKRMVE